MEVFDRQVAVIYKKEKNLVEGNVIWSKKH